MLTLTAIVYMMKMNTRLPVVPLLLWSPVDR